MSEVSDNLVVGRGVLTYAPYLVGETSGGVYGDFGNTPGFTLSQTSQNLDHFSSRHGLRVKDRSVVLQQDMTGTIEVDDISNGNMALWFGGDVDGTAPADAPATIGDLVVIARAKSLYGALLYQPDNPIGDNTNWWFPYTNLQPNGNFAMIGETWQTMQFNVQILKRDRDTERGYGFFPAGGASTATDDTPRFTPMSAGASGGSLATAATASVPATAAIDALFDVTFTLTGGNVAYLFLHDGTALVGTATVISGASGTAPMSAALADTYTAKIFADPLGATVALVTSGNIVVS